MADWTVITDSQVDPDAPLTSELAYAWRDNVIAAFEGAVGAPRLAFGALDSWYSTAGAVGTYVLATRTGGNADVAFGATLAGSNLSVTGALSRVEGGTSSDVGVGGTLSGTWRAMSIYEASPGGSARSSALWIRIS